MVNKIIIFVLIFAAILVIYFGIHFYVFFRLSNFLKIKRTALFYIVFAILTLSFPLMMFIERYFTGTISRIFYFFSMVWFGTIFLLLCAMLIYEVLRLFVKTNSQIAGLVILGIILFLVIYSIINAFSLNVKTIEIPTPNLEKETTLVQLSDLHLGTIHNSKYLQKVVDKTNSLNPDIVMITGDLFDSGGVLNESIYSPLNNLKAKTFFTTGNHEQYVGLDKVMELLNKTKVQVLRNELVTYGGIQIVGIDNPSGFTTQSNVLDSITINKSKPSILMYHMPANLEKANEKGINLQLSGHTHDGQIFPFNIFERVLVFKYMVGIYNYNGTYLYVSPGTGTWGPPMRLGSKNEITLIKLVKFSI